MEIQKSTIEKMEVLLVEAIRSSDIKQLDKILHDELRCMIPDGQIITKDMDLSSHKSGEMVVDELIPSIENIQIIGDTALVTVVYTTKGRMMGNPVEGTFRYLRVWKQFGNSLKVIAVSCFKIK